MVTQSLNPHRMSRMIRRGSEHSLLGCSLNLGTANPFEKLSLSPSLGGKDRKFKTLEKLKVKKSKNKKADTFGGRGSGTATPTSAFTSPSKSSMYFSGSPSRTSISGSLGPSAIFSNPDLTKTPKKSKWMNLRNKVGKRFLRSPSDTEDVRLQNKPQRSHSIPSIKKHVVYSGRNTSVSGEELGMISMPDGGSISMVSPRIRKPSTSQGNNINLVSKIFSVLKCWVDEYFEVSLVFCGISDFEEWLSFGTSYYRDRGLMSFRTLFVPT